MSDLRDLYQEVILDHSRSPRNFKVLDGATHQADGYNPLCGDKVTFFLKCDGDIVKEVSFQGAGCAISTASASLLTEYLVGKTRQEVQEIFDRFHEMVTGDTEKPLDQETLGKLAVFQGVCEYPARVKCATLAWHTIKAALENRGEPASTE
jgi:nitrogen fixation NifU-like protein